MSKTYVELLIEGPDDYARGYIRGFVAARGPQAEVIFDDEAGFADDGIVQKLKEALHIAKQITHCVVDEDTAVLVREAISTPVERLLSIHSDRVIEHASFKYEFAVFNKENGAKFVKCVGDLPTGVTLEGHELDESIRPDAHGSEFYSPAHEYELKGEGKAIGPINKIVWLYKEFDSIDQVNVESIHVQYAKR